MKKNEECKTTKKKVIIRCFYSTRNIHYQCKLIELKG